MVPTARAPRIKKDKVVKSVKPNGDNLHLAIKVMPKTEGQRQMMFAFEEGLNILAYGSAGTGKSYVACHLALKKLFADPKRNKIVIVRSAVQTREMGFLPGSLDEKSDPYKAPYKAIINQLCGNGTAWDILTKKGMVEFITSSYVRGITIEDCTIIIDEYQNMSQHECQSVLTRVGENCQVIMLGDTKQTDLNKKKEESCFDWVLNVTRRMSDWFDVVHFTPADIVRSGFCKALILAIEDIA
jgi:phosphate starvation-inducible PhoH-like protein